eukprot:gene1486-1928_t
MYATSVFPSSASISTPNPESMLNLEPWEMDMPIGKLGPQLRTPSASKPKTALNPRGKVVSNVVVAEVE